MLSSGIDLSSGSIEARLTCLRIYVAPLLKLTPQPAWMRERDYNLNSVKQLTPEVGRLRFRSSYVIFRRQVHRPLIGQNFFVPLTCQRESYPLPLGLHRQPIAAALGECSGYCWC